MLSIASTSKLDLQDLRKRQDEKEKRRLEVYDSVLKKCHTQILRSNESNRDNTFFQVPRFQLGSPPISNFKACLAYIIYNLRNNGLSVNYFHPDTLWITWGATRPAALPASVDRVDFLGQQPLRHDDKIEKAARVIKPVVKSKEERLLQINKAVCREIPKEREASQHTIYDGDALQSLKYFADRIKKK